MARPSSPTVLDTAHSCEDYTIGWICTQAKEQTAAITMLDEIHKGTTYKQNKDPNTYNLGSIEQHNVVIACLSFDHSSSTVATIAVWMTTTFPAIRLCLLVGLGSGIPPKVRLGDVVIGVPYDGLPGVVECQRSETEGYRKTGEMGRPPSILLSALTKLQSIHEIDGSKIPKYLAKMGKNERLASKYLVSDALQDPLLVSGATAPGVHGQSTKLELRETEIHYGLIANTSIQIRDKVTRENFGSSLGNHRLLCIYTEAPGLMTNFPCIVIRGICDYADEHRDNYKGWQEPAAAVSAAFAKEVLSVLPEAEVASLSTIKSLGASVF
ncbi:nucleoside phosphorylase domain-containing protein [Annulohypoxylon moriforme]|nr:nucleoside phosphorylase domain-containing protein [Annulohypoxylon moriforme]